MSNFGAMDLSGLANKETQPEGAAISSWLVRGDEDTLRRYLTLSESTPVLMLITDQSDVSTRLRQLVNEVLAGSEGRFAGIEIDITSNPQLAQAVAVDKAPAMLAILAGQPAPLFQGEATKEQLLNVLSQVLSLAAKKNITKTVTLGAVAPIQKELSPEHQAALAALEANDLNLAHSLYEKIITEYPNDSEAKASLTQVKLMLRMSSEPEQGELAELFRSADQMLIAGNAAGSLAVLLDAFEMATDRRDEIRDRLLELFILIGDSEPEVLAARRRLATMLF
ncbi:MAG: tetratricopeptide repeat protein [Aquiluna sp.]|nr:tetratricopeptide repeat protein [Aquiluna sp.]